MTVNEIQVHPEQLISCPCCQKAALVRDYIDEEYYCSESLIACPSCKFMVYQLEDEGEFIAPHESRVIIWQDTLRSHGFKSFEHARLTIDSIKPMGQSTIEFDRFDVAKFQRLGGALAFYEVPRGMEAYYARHPSSRTLYRQEKNLLQMALMRGTEPMQFEDDVPF